MKKDLIEGLFEQCDKAQIEICELMKKLIENHKRSCFFYNMKECIIVYQKINKIKQNLDNMEYNILSSP